MNVVGLPHPAIRPAKCDGMMPMSAEAPTTRPAKAGDVPRTSTNNIGRKAIMENLVNIRRNPAYWRATTPCIRKTRPNPARIPVRRIVVPSDGGSVILASTMNPNGTANNWPSQGACQVEAARTPPSIGKIPSPVSIAIERRPWPRMSSDPRNASPRMVIVKGRSPANASPWANRIARNNPNDPVENWRRIPARPNSTIDQPKTLRRPIRSARSPAGRAPRAAGRR